MLKHVFHFFVIDVFRQAHHDGPKLWIKSNFILFLSDNFQKKRRKEAPTSMFFTSSSSMYSGKLIMMVLNYKSRHLLSSLALVCRGSSAVVFCAEAGSMYEDVRGGHARPACSPRGSRHQHNGYMITIVLIIYQIEARADLFLPISSLLSRVH